MRPGYLAGKSVSLDPIRMGVIWQDAPRRILPATFNRPRHPVQAMVFARVAIQKPEAIPALLEAGSSVLLVLDEPGITPEDLGISRTPGNGWLVPVIPVLPPPLANGPNLPRRWGRYTWGSVLGLFPFPGASDELERQLRRLYRAGASFAVAAPLLLTPKDRHRILDGCDDGSGVADELENCLFHADVSRGLHALERRAGMLIDELGMEAIVPGMFLAGCHPKAIHTAALLRLWARRLDQSHEESSWGWRLRQAAAALERIPNDPELLAAEGNLRVIPGFDEWVQAFTLSLWYKGDPVEAAWNRWTRRGNGR